MLAGGAMHLDSLGRHHIHADLARIVHPHLVFHDFGFQAVLLELPGNIVGGLLVFRRTRHVRRRGEGAQVLFRLLGVGNRQEELLPLLFWRGIAEAGYGGSGGSRFRRLGPMLLLAGAKNPKNCGQSQDRRGPPLNARSPRQSREETESLHEGRRNWEAPDQSFEFQVSSFSTLLRGATRAWNSQSESYLLAKC